MSVETCPHCDAKLPSVTDAYCDYCRRDLSEPVEKSLDKPAIGLRREDVWFKSELLEVARHQKSIQWMILIGVVGVFAMAVFPPAPLVVAVIQLYFIYNLAVAVRSSVPWIYCLLAFIPLIGLLSLLSINGRATKLLNRFGVKVGLMGARLSDFDKLPEGRLA